MNINRTSIAAAALIAALTTDARAADAPGIHVNYADLNVNTRAGAAALFRRIRVAADRVCDFRDSRDLSLLAKVEACTQHAIAEAVATVNNPHLTAVYEGEMAKTPATRLAGVR